MSTAHVAELMKTKQRITSERGDSFPAWVLDQLQYRNHVSQPRGHGTRIVSAALSLGGL